MKQKQSRAALKRLRKSKKRYLGLTELAAVLGITNHGCWNRRRDKQLPIPIELACGPLWTAKQIKVWLSTKESK